MGIIVNCIVRRLETSNSIYSWIFETSDSIYSWIFIYVNGAWCGCDGLTNYFHNKWSSAVVRTEDHTCSLKSGSCFQFNRGLKELLFIEHKRILRTSWRQRRFLEKSVVMDRRRASCHLIQNLAGVWVSYLFAVSAGSARGEPKKIEIPTWFLSFCFERKQLC